MDLAVVLGADERPPLVYRCSGDVWSLKFSVGLCLPVLVARLSSSSISFLCCAYRSVGRNKTSLVLNHQLYKNSELAQVSHYYLFGRYSQTIESKGNLSGSTLNCFYVLSLLYLRKSAACLAVYSSGVGLSLGSGDHVSLMGALSVPGLLCRLVCAWSRRVTWLFSVGTLTWFLVRF